MKAAVLVVLGVLVAMGVATSPAGAPPPGWSPPPLPRLFGEYMVSNGVFKADLVANQAEHKVKTNRVILEERTGDGWKVRDQVRVSMKGSYTDAKLRFKLPEKKRKVFIRVRSFGPQGKVATLDRTLVHMSGRLLKAKVVSEGFGQTCVVLLNDRVKCWGLNKSGQLGTGDRKWTTLPVSVSGLARVRSVAASDEFTCAIRWNRQLACWGDNYYGVLANGSREGSLVPQDVAGMKKIRQVSAGPNNVCALTMRDKVYCWGSNGGSIKNETWTLRPVQVKNLKNVAKVTAGLGSSCAILKSSRVTCWSHKDLKPKPRKGLGKVRQLLLAFEGGCAVRISKRVVCWGTNDWGELGIGSKVRHRKSPVPVKKIGKVRSIGGEGTSRCAVDVSGQTWCWGDGQSGGLGNGEAKDRYLPVRVRGVANARSIASSHSQGSCVVNQDQTVYCWGDNSAGSVGNGTTIDQLTAVPVLAR